MVKIYIWIQFIYKIIYFIIEALKLSWPQSIFRCAFVLSVSSTIQVYLLRSEQSIFCCRREVVRNPPQSRCGRTATYTARHLAKWQICRACCRSKRAVGGAGRRPCAGWVGVQQDYSQWHSVWFQFQLPSAIRRVTLSFVAVCLPNALPTFRLT